jgi:hypothetical protein
MRSILNKVAGLLAPDRALLAGAVVFLLAAAAAELAIPHYITAAVFAAAKVGRQRWRGAGCGWGWGCLQGGSKSGARSSSSICHAAASHYYPAIHWAHCCCLQERSEDLFKANLAFLCTATACYAGFAAVRGWLFSLLNTNLLQRLR